MDTTTKSTAIVGRTYEKSILQQCVDSGRPEFLAVYGRRRVGKTFLVKEFFHNRFSFYATGAKSKEKKIKLSLFGQALASYGSDEHSAPENWFEAFARLRSLLESPRCYRDKASKRKVVFLDELPWMDSPRSEFKAALDYFWNAYASSQKDILLIVCGSATSWIINNIARDTGGFYNRLTNQICLAPFHLKECEELSKALGFDFSKETIAKGYMIFGGVPFYWNLLLPSESLDQGIDRLCFNEKGALRYEYQNLFASLFSSRSCHLEIVTALSKKASGLTREELLAQPGIGGGKSLTKALEELEQCGFVRKFARPGKTNGAFYQIFDPFCRFATDFLLKKKASSWLSYGLTPSYYSWLGNAFELLCLNHVDEIKNALGISGVETEEYSYRSKTHSPGAQIDLVIDRKDGVSNLCEMKYTSSPFKIDRECAANLENKQEAFRLETKTKNAARITLISASGIARTKYSDVVRNVITLQDLFK